MGGRLPQAGQRVEAHRQARQAAEDQDRGIDYDSFGRFRCRRLRD